MDDLARQLADAEERFRLAFDRAPTAMVLVRPTGEFIRVNDAATRLFGLEVEELLAHTFQDLTHPDDLAADLDLVHQVLTGELSTYTLEKRFRYRDGGWVSAQIDVSLVRDAAGVPQYFVSQIQDISDRRASEDGLLSADRTQRATLNALAQGIVFTDLAGEVLLQNRGAHDILGVGPEELTRVLQSTDWETLAEAEELAAGGRPDLDGAADDRPLTRTNRTAEPVRGVRLRWRRPDGEVLVLRLSTEPIHDEEGTHIGVVSAITDVTEREDVDRARQLAEAALRASQARFEALVERSTDTIAVVAADGRITYSSPAGERLFGHPTGSLDQRPFVELVHPDDLAEIQDAFVSLLAEGGSTGTHEVRIRSVDGDWRWVEVVATNRLSDPAVEGIVANVRDVTERVESAAQLAWQAYHDPLTGLPNRLLLMDRLEQAIAQARRAGDRAALLFIDLDRFKVVNDSLGHAVGDDVLVEVGQRIVGAVRPGDTVSRHGGDEFMVVLAGPGVADDAGPVAEAIRVAVERPLHVAGSVINISASIGIAFDAGAEAPDVLLRDADLALYRAKERGRNRAEVFNEELRNASKERVEAEHLLRDAHASDRLQVFHQPIVDLASGRLLGTEALLRVPEADGRLASATRFLGVAEDSGLIVPIGELVLDRSCAALAAWRAADDAVAPDHVAVNVSARQLGTASFVPAVQATLARHGLTADRLVLELTEAAIIAADRGTRRAIEAIHSLGVRLAIDDFGTGYSSLTYLKRFPIDWVKVDRSFVAGLGTDASDTAIVDAVVGLGRSLGLKVVAEGIETHRQLDALRALGCHAGQGFLLGRPAPAADVLLGSRQLDGRAGQVLPG